MCSREAGFPQRRHGRSGFVRVSLIIFGFGKSSIRLNAISGLYSPGPSLECGLSFDLELLEEVDFILPVYFKSPYLGIPTSVGVLQCLKLAT